MKEKTVLKVYTAVLVVCLTVLALHKHTHLFG